MIEETTLSDPADDSQSGEAPRRRFLVATAGLAGTAVAGTLGGGGVTFVLGTPVGDDARSDWAIVGHLDDLPDGDPVRRIVTATTIAGWAREVRAHVVWLLRRGQEVVAWSAVCPHQGCPIVRAEGGAGFECRCHGSAWDAEGTRLAGPAPRAMDALDLEVMRGEVRVRPRRFEPGIPERKERG